MIKLYYAVNTCSLASHIALEEAGAAYTTVKVSFAGNEQRSPEYLAVNPKGRVPAITMLHGATLTICAPARTWVRTQESCGSPSSRSRAT